MHPPWHRELIRAMGPRYRTAPRAEKTRMLDEFCAVTGYHRKYAIRRLGEKLRTRPSRPRGRPPKYEFEAVRLLASIWIAAGCPWSKKLERDLPQWIEWAKERHEIPTDLEEQVLAMSARTIDRRLKPYREQLKRWPEHLRRKIGRGEAKSRIFYAPGPGSAGTRTLVIGPAGGSSDDRSRDRAPRDDSRGRERSRLSRGRNAATLGAQSSSHSRRSVMEIKKRKERGVVIVSVRGEMVRQAGSFPIMKHILEEIDDEKKFIIDLGKVNKMDSAGVGELVAINVAIKEKGGELRLANLEEKVGKILHMALVHKIVPVFDTQKEAIESFGEDVFEED